MEYLQRLNKSDNATNQVFVSEGCKKQLHRGVKVSVCTHTKTAINCQSLFKTYLRLLKLKPNLYFLVTTCDPLNQNGSKRNPRQGLPLSYQLITRNSLVSQLELHILNAN